MCRPVVCKTCSKTTWSGCGQHVAQVKANVARENWCDGTHTEAQLQAAQEADRRRTEENARPARSLMEWFRRRA